jgi:methionine-rich copper-binding protein CopC
LLRFTGIVVFVALICIALSVQPASAHATLAMSNPPADSVVPTTPDEIRLTFDKEINPDLSSMELVNATGSTIAEGEADLNDPDRASMTINLADDIPPGTYTVTWVVVESDEADQHEVEGQYSFAIDPTATATASPTAVIAAPEGTIEPTDDASGNDTDDTDGIGRGALIVGAVTIVVAIAVVASVGRRRLR